MKLRKLCLCFVSGLHKGGFLMATEKRAFLLQQWSEIIQARVASGKCIRHWCNEHGVRENQYYYCCE